MCRLSVGVLPVVQSGGRSLAGISHSLVRLKVLPLANFRVYKVIRFIRWAEYEGIRLLFESRLDNFNAHLLFVDRIGIKKLFSI